MVEQSVESPVKNKGGRPRLSEEEKERRRLEKDAQPKRPRGRPSYIVNIEEHKREMSVKHYHKDPERARLHRRQTYYNRIGKPMPDEVKPCGRKIVVM